MEKEFVPYNIAISLKELEFKERCFAMYNDQKILLYCYPHECFSGYDIIERAQLFLPNNTDKNLAAPLWQQAFNWFRANYNLQVGQWMAPPEEMEAQPELYPHKYYFTIYYNEDIVFSKDSDSYEEVQLACIQQLIKIIKDAK